MRSRERRTRETPDLDERPLMAYLIWGQTAAGVGAAFAVDWRAALTGLGLCAVGVVLAFVFVATSRSR